MKKLFSVFNGGKKSNQSNDCLDTANVNYTKEFPYLPSYHWIQSFAYTPAATEESLAEAKYLIPNTFDTEVYKEYKAILIKDGWTITDELAVTSFSAKKDTHMANVLIWISEKNVLLTIRSK